MPLFGAAQAGVLFPLNWFYLAFNAPVATNLMMLSSYIVAALGAYVYARRSGSSIAGAALTSLVWQASGFLIGQIGHTNIVHTAALLPWLLWAVDGYGTSGKRNRGVLLSALVALQVFAGHQQTFVYSLLVVAAYAVVMWRGTKQPGPSSRQSLKRSRAYLWSLVFIAAGMALAAVQILPTLELLRNSLRSEASYSFFTSFSLPPRFLWTFFAPYLLGGGAGQLFRARYVGPEFYGEYIGYVGLATITLGILAVVLNRDTLTKFWAVVTLVALTLALGRYAPSHFYKLVYFVPVLNLFRVPARHTMEVEFALAVLAGRGLTAITEARDRSKTLRWTLLISASVFVLTCLAVTVGRPGNFQLGRNAPVSILRAPELFLPIIIAAIAGWTLWKFAKHPRRRTLILLLAVIALDLCLWGQSSGWRRSSPTSDFELWRTPPIVEFLRTQSAKDRAAGLVASERVLTFDRTFEPEIQDRPPELVAAKATEWVPTLQPDIYMMYGLENAAGYDGFGLARYSRLAGDMKVWGELGDAPRTFGPSSRELDLLNVRYLLTKSSADATGPAESPAKPAKLISATQILGGESFGEESLTLPGLGAGQRLSFTVPPVEADRLALVTNLAWSETVPDKTVVAHLSLHGQNGETFDYELRAGEHTSEWAFDRPDIRPRIKHKRAVVATSYDVEDAQAKYEGHTYVSSFAFPRAAVITAGQITTGPVPGAPNLTLSVLRIAFAGGDKAFAIGQAFVRKENVPRPQPINPAAGSAVSPSVNGLRWRRLGDVGRVTVFENLHTLPRAWLAMGEIVATDEEELAIIRTGKTLSGSLWDPREHALVESGSGVNFVGSDEKSGQDARAEITRYEPNRVEVKTESKSPSILVLSENHYPGWRAYVDGRATEVLRVNFNQRGVALPTGNHLVTFVFQPKSLLVGFVISLLTLVLLLAWAMGTRTGLFRRRVSNFQSPRSKVAGV